MTIETKFNISDTIWFMNGNKAECCTVTSMKMGMDNHTNKNLWIFYSPYFRNYWISESKCFSTKEDLLKSL